jgi:hypothetical protein
MDTRLHPVSVYSAILLMLACSAAQAAESLWDRLQIHGFASQAVLQTSDNRWFGNSDQTSFDFTEIGLNASMRLDPKLLLAGQVLYRRAGEMYESDLALDYGLADITPLSSAAGRLGLRVGRIKNPLGLYNETRDVPFTHPGIFLPQVVYFDRVRNLVLSTDGAMIYGDRYTRFGNFSFTVGNGWSVIDDNVEWAYLNGRLSRGHPSQRHDLACWPVVYRRERALQAGLSGMTLSINSTPTSGVCPPRSRTDGHRLLDCFGAIQRGRLDPDLRVRPRAHIMARLWLHYYRIETQPARAGTYKAPTVCAQASASCCVMKKATPTPRTVTAASWRQNGRLGPSELRVLQDPLRRHPLGHQPPLDGTR